MVNARALILAIAFAAVNDPSEAGTYRFFSSAGAESQIAPADASSPLNPDNTLDLPDHTNTVDVVTFMEGTSATRRWKARAKIRGDATDGGPDHAQVSEAFLQVQVRDWIDLTAGRIIEKWGTGYGWTPTAFIGPSRNPTDPNDRRSTNRGVDMLRVDVLASETSVSLFALERRVAAIRVNRLIRATDLSLYARRDRESARYGLSLSRVFGPALECHTDIAWLEDSRGKDVVRLAAGGQFTFGNGANVVLEVFHGGDGLTSGQWDAFRETADAAVESGNRQRLLQANGAFRPLRMARKYAFMRIYRDDRERRVDGEIIVIANLRDASMIVRTTLSRRLRPNLNVYVTDMEFLGAERTEMSYIQIERATTFGIRLSY